MRNLNAVLLLALLGLCTSFQTPEPLASQVDRARGRPIIVFIHGRAQAGRTQDVGGPSGGSANGAGVPRPGWIDTLRTEFELP